MQIHQQHANDGDIEMGENSFTAMANQMPEMGEVLGITRFRADTHDNRGAPLTQVG